MKIIQNAFVYLRTHGLRRFIAEIWHRIFEHYNERRLNVATAGTLTTEQLAIENEEWNFYVPMSYRAIYSVLRDLPIDKSNSTFLDYGCGKGRAVIAAATFPFKRVIGVEVSEQLAASARENVAKMRKKRAGHTEIKEVDGAEFSLPSDVNVIYFFNPFTGDLLKKVVDNIRASYQATPRKIHIIYVVNDRFEEAIIGQDWLSKTRDIYFYPNLPCGLYETV